MGEGIRGGGKQGVGWREGRLDERGARGKGQGA